jgi:hypothetical protein
MATRYKLILLLIFAVTGFAMLIVPHSRSESETYLILDLDPLASIHWIAYATPFLPVILILESLIIKRPFNSFQKFLFVQQGVLGLVGMMVSMMLFDLSPNIKEALPTRYVILGLEILYAWWSIALAFPKPRFIKRGLFDTVREEGTET